MITLICLWGHRECKAAKTAPSMLAAVFDNGLQETSRSRRRYRPEHVTPTKVIMHAQSSSSSGPLGRTLAYVALLKHEDFSTHCTYPICNTVDPFAKKISEQGERCARATTHVLTD